MKLTLTTLSDYCFQLDVVKQKLKYTYHNCFDQFQKTQTPVTLNQSAITANIRKRYKTRENSRQFVWLRRWQRLKVITKGTKMVINYHHEIILATRHSVKNYSI